MGLANSIFPIDSRLKVHEWHKMSGRSVVRLYHSLSLHNGSNASEWMNEQMNEPCLI